MTTGQDVLDATAFRQGNWGTGGIDGVGFYEGGTVGVGTATLTGTLTGFGDAVTATLGGASLTLHAYAEVAGGAGIVLTDASITKFYVFLTSPFDPAQHYALSYAFGGFNPPCFVTGTCLTTARGEVAVEALRVGDLALALRGRRFAEVVWIGRRRVSCRGHPRGEDVWPVRIAAGAFAADLPRRDLWLSPDHALYLDGALVPVRFLVNGATVTQAVVDDVTYWHVELATHEVLCAEGLPVESYLDTGNRAAFRQASGPSRFRRADRDDAWAMRACAPLQLDPAAHRPVRSRLLARATVLGHAQTADPALSVVAGGASLPLRRVGDTWLAGLPARVREVRLLSRSAIPAEFLADGTDRRRLGIAVTHLTLDGVPIPPADARRGAGWHQPEATLHWTDGDAALACGRAGPGLRRLEIGVAPLLRYWLASAPSAAADTGALTQGARPRVPEAA